MESVDGLLAWVAESWAALPGLPDLGLPTPADPPLLIVIASVVTALGIMGVMTGWVEKRLSLISLTAAIFGAALFFWVWEADRENVGLISVPKAFIEMVARVLR